MALLPSRSVTGESVNALRSDSLLRRNRADVSFGPMTGSDAKLQRARKYVAEFEAEARSFWSRKPFTLQNVEGAEGDLITLVRTREAPPFDWGLILGDAVHNYRAALDILVNELLGGASTQETAFPIARSAVFYRSLAPMRLAGLGKVPTAAIKSLKPWAGGNDSLWALHCLDIADKHQLLVPVAAAVRHFTMNSSIQFPDAAEPLSTGVSIRPADRQFGLVDGDEVFRIMKAARDVGAPNFNLSHGITFEVAFDRVSGIPGASVADTLTAIDAEVVRVITAVRSSLR
jgi:hypothetical protein